MQLCYGQVVQEADQLQLAPLVYRANDHQKQDANLHGMYVYMLEFVSFDLQWAARLWFYGPVISFLMHLSSVANDVINVSLFAYDKITL